MRALLSRWQGWWDHLHDSHSHFIDTIPASWTSTGVFTASALTLYLEMVMVRWHASCFHAFAIFKNVSLLSCFLGLGIGYGLSGRHRIRLAGVLPLLALQALLFGLLSSTKLGGRGINPVAEQLVMGTLGDKWSWLSAVEGNGFLAAVFVLNALMFIPLGHLAGRLMSRLPKIQSYSLNVLGSLAGIGLFFLLSLAWTGPAVWMGVAVLTLAPFLVGHPRSVAVGVASLAVVLLALGIMGNRQGRQYFSPYQVIDLRLPGPDDKVPTMTVKVNHCFYQDILDCRPAATAVSDKHRQALAYYDLPYRLRGEPGDVLVVGAGTGNDVAAALRHNARSVTAVEIDPAILYLGQRLHPERVYQDPRTRPVVNDARSFLRQTDQTFDTVIYGLLDSHTNLGAMTNVRLDSFVYTVEGFRDGLRRLSDRGLLVVSYLVLDPRQGDKLFAMLRAAYPDRMPRAFTASTYGGTTFVTGPGLTALPQTLDGIEELTASFTRSAAHAQVATDDWPFFYMQERSYPLSYAVMILLLLGLSSLLVKRNLGIPRLLRAFGKKGGQSPFFPNALTAQSGVFFFLGAGFMLIETKSITELGLVFGNTWSVIAVAISGILLMVYLANLWVWRRGPVSFGKAFAMLGAALLAGWGLTYLSRGGVAVPLPKLVMPLALTLPLLFAGLIFSSALAGGSDIGSTLSANLFGAMLGGFLEYNSMYWGYSSLYPLGMGLYLLAFLLQRKVSRQQRRSALGLDSTGAEVCHSGQAA